MLEILATTVGSEATGFRPTIKLHIGHSRFTYIHSERFPSEDAAWEKAEYLIDDLDATVVATLKMKGFELR